MISDHDIRKGEPNSGLFVSLNTFPTRGSRRCTRGRFISSNTNNNRDLVFLVSIGCVDIVCKPKTRLTSIADYLRGALDIIYPPHI